jgi:hypothetical protein
MRIIGEIQDNRCKISIFQMNDKFSVKFESGQYEQIFKYRIGEYLHSLEDVKRLIDKAFIDNVLAIFPQMVKINNRAFEQYHAEESEDFDTII